MGKDRYDIFISYRRVGGKNYARTLKPELEKRGFRVFLDFDELKDGVFDKRIMDAINEAPIFLVILSKGALDRCANDGDWVREEILYADKTKRHIVPVEVDKTFREFPENLPNEVKSVLGPHQFSQIDTETLLQESIDKMVRERIKPYVKNVSGAPSPLEEESTEGAEIHIEVDVDCDLYRFKKLIKELSSNEDNIVYLKPGKHKIEFVSHEYSDVKESMLLDIPYEKYSDFITVTLLPQIQKKKEEEAAKHKAEKEAKQKTEELRIKEDAQRKEVANYPACSTKKIAIIGPVGSGVTSLLCGIIGNMCRYYGAIYDMPYTITSYSYNDEGLNRPIENYIKQGFFSSKTNEFTFPDKSVMNSSDTTIFRIRCIIPHNKKKDAFHLYFSNLAGEDCVYGHLEAFDGADYVILCLPPINDDTGNTEEVREVFTYLANYIDKRCCKEKLKFTLVLTKKDLWDQKQLLSPNNDYTHNAMSIWEAIDLKRIGWILDINWGDYPCFAVNLIDKDNEGLKLLCNMIVQDAQNELPWWKKL